MSPYVRKVKTASGATAVQIVEKRNGRRRIVEHIGSARDETELAALMSAAQQRVNGVQDDMLPFEPLQRSVSGPVVENAASEALWEVLINAYRQLGFDQIDDEAFTSLVAARIVEPTSKLDTVRVLGELGMPAPHVNTLYNCLRRCVQRDYRAQLSTACWTHASAAGPVALVMYDLTTLHFEVSEEDRLRKVGMSKERRVDPQITVGLLVTASGFPLEVAMFEGNKAETKTLIPVIEAFQSRHQISDLVVVADAGMLSAANLNALEDAGYRFIVGSRQSSVPYDLGDHFERHGNYTPDDSTIEASRDMGTGKDRRTRRVVYHYSFKRRQRDDRAINAQVAKAEKVAAGERPIARDRFVTVTADAGGKKAEVNWEIIKRARFCAGFKGFVTNIGEDVLDGSAVVAAYQDLWRIEESFRMSKSDLRARPVFHRKKESIDAHLTIVFAGLAVARYLQDRTGVSIKRLVQVLRPLRTVTITIAGQPVTAQPRLGPDAIAILDTIPDLTGHQNRPGLWNSGQTTRPLAADLASAEIVDAAPHARPMRVVLMGRTMAGKSTLLAALTGGSAERIGVGAQRTTRDVLTAPALGLVDVEIVDTPGVGAKDGAEDVAVAMAELPAADLVLWVASNDSFQEETAQALREVALRGKPVVVALNCRARLVDDLDREDFLADPEAVFAQHEGHFSTIRSHLAHAGVRPVVEVMLHAEAARQGRTDVALSDQLAAASRLEMLLAVLAVEARERRVARRVLRGADEVRSQALELAEALSAVEVSVQDGAQMSRGLRVDQEQRTARLVTSCAQRMDDEVVRLVGLRRTWHQTVTDFGPDVVTKWEQEQAALTADLERALNSQLSELSKAVDEANQAARREWSTVPRQQLKVEGLQDFRGLWRRRVAGLAVGGGGALALAAVGLAVGGPVGLGAAILGPLLIPQARKKVQSLFRSKAKILLENRELLGSGIEKVLAELETQTRAAAAGSIKIIRDQLAEASRERAAAETSALAVADVLASQRAEVGAVIAALDLATVRCLLVIDRRPRLANSVTRATRLPGVCATIQLEEASITEAWLFPPSTPEIMTFGHITPANLPGVMATFYVLGLTEEVPRLTACRPENTIVETSRLVPAPVATAWSAVLSDHLQTPVTIRVSTSPRSAPA